MALLRIIGFEMGGVQEVVSLGNFSSIQSAVVISGGYSLKAAVNNPSTATILISGISEANISCRFKFRQEGNPAGAILGINSSSSGALFDIDSVGTAIQIFDHASAGYGDTVGTTTFQNNTTYEIRFVLDCAAGGIFKLWVDNTLEIDTTHSNLISNVERIYTYGQKNQVCYWDDFRIADDLTEPPRGLVIARQVIAGTPTNNAFTKTGGTNIVDVWNNTPFTTATNANSGTANAAQTALAALFDATQAGHGSEVIAASATINAAWVAAVAKTSATSSNGALYSIRRIIGGSTVDEAFSDLTTTDSLKRSAFFTPTFAQLSSGAVPEIGWVKGAGTRTHTVEDVWLMVDYQPDLSSPVSNSISFNTASGQGLVNTRSHTSEASGPVEPPSLRPSNLEGILNLASARVLVVEGLQRMEPLLAASLESLLGLNRSSALLTESVGSVMPPGERPSNVEGTQGLLPARSTTNESQSALANTELTNTESLVTINQDRIVHSESVGLVVPPGERSSYVESLSDMANSVVGNNEGLAGQAKAIVLSIEAAILVQAICIASIEAAIAVQQTGTTQDEALQEALTTGTHNTETLQSAAQPGTVNAEAWQGVVSQILSNLESIQNLTQSGVFHTESSIFLQQQAIKSTESIAALAETTQNLIHVVEALVVLQTTGESSVESGAYASHDSSLQTEGLMTTRGDKDQSIESTVSLLGSVTSALESVLAQMQLVSSHVESELAFATALDADIESTVFVGPSTDMLIEAAHAMTVSATLLIESIAVALQAAETPISSGQSTDAEAQARIEALSQPMTDVSSARLHLVETVQILSAAASSLLESLESIAGEQQTGFETRFMLVKLLDMGVESSQLVTADTVLSTDTIGQVTQLGTVTQEGLEFLSTSSGSLIEGLVRLAEEASSNKESLIGLAADRESPICALRFLIRDGDGGYETSIPVFLTVQAEVEAVVGAAATGILSHEAYGIIQSLVEGNIEAMSILALATGEVVIDALFGLTATRETGFAVSTTKKTLFSLRKTEEVGFLASDPE